MRSFFLLFSGSGDLFRQGKDARVMSHVSAESFEVILAGPRGMAALSLWCSLSQKEGMSLKSG